MHVHIREFMLASMLLTRHQRKFFEKKSKQEKKYEAPQGKRATGWIKLIVETKIITL